MKLFNRFGSKDKSGYVDRIYTLYVRDAKPSAMQGWIFSDSVVESVPMALSGACPVWIWESTRTGPPLQAADETPEHRERQVVTEVTAPLLVADLVEKNLNGFKRFVALYGGDADLLNLTTDDELMEAVEAFAEGKPSPLTILLVQMGDVAADVLYFNSSGTEAAEKLLQKYNVPSLSNIHKYSYREMNGEELETVMTYLSCAEHDH